MARQLGQSMSKIAAVVGCSLSAAVSIYEKWAKEGTVVNQGQSQWHPGPSDAHGEGRLACVVGSDRKSEYTDHHSLLLIGLHGCKLARSLC